MVPLICQIGFQFENFFGKHGLFVRAINGIRKNNKIYHIHYTDGDE